MSRVLRRVIAAAPFLLSGNLGRFRPGTENALPAGLTASMKELKVRRSHHRILKRSKDRPIKARESAPWKSYENFNISGRRARSPRVSHQKRMKKRERTILSRKHSGLSLRKNRRKASRRSRKRRKRRRIACQQMRDQPDPIPQLLPSLLLFNGLKEVPQAPMNNHQATTPPPFLSVDCTVKGELPPSLTLKGGSPADAPTLDQPENPSKAPGAKFEWAAPDNESTADYETLFAEWSGILNSCEKRFIRPRAGDEHCLSVKKDCPKDIHFFIASLLREVCSLRDLTQRSYASNSEVEKMERFTEDFDAFFGNILSYFVDTVGEQEVKSGKLGVLKLLVDQFLEGCVGLHVKEIEIVVRRIKSWPEDKQLLIGTGEGLATLTELAGNVDEAKEEVDEAIRKAEEEEVEEAKDLSATKPAAT